MEIMALEEKNAYEPQPIDEEHAKRLLGEDTCERGLSCIESGFTDMHRARYIGSDLYAICLDGVKDCKFAVYADYTYLCKCPVRVHIAKTLGK